jgi:hypothetical protein
MRLYWRTENLAKARSWAEKALEIVKRLNAYDVIADSYIVLSAVFSVTGEDRKKAVEYGERALKKPFLSEPHLKNLRSSSSNPFLRMTTAESN